MGMVVFVAIAVGAAVVSGRAGQQPVEEEDIYWVEEDIYSV